LGITLLPISLAHGHFVLNSCVPCKILGVIPARYASSRFPGKALATIASKTMLEHVYGRVKRSRYVDPVVIATDDQRIFDAARSFGAEVRMTRGDHISGTDRVAEVASRYDTEIVVNIQGDEPLIDPEAIDSAVLPLIHEPAISMSTLRKRIEDPLEVTNPNVVKVVTDRFQNAIYFSRSPIPFDRGGDHGREQSSERGKETVHFKHIGLYVYRKTFLLRYSELPVGPLEEAERLEQLRALENGFKIRVVETEYESLGVDTPEDLERVTHLFESSMALTALTSVRGPANDG
jgi:3-deoxy-manno-octulosonate cytidylyltransferase (CMP-KDO synthetase)